MSERTFQEVAAEIRRSVGLLESMYDRAVKPPDTRPPTRPPVEPPPTGRLPEIEVDTGTFQFAAGGTSELVRAMDRATEYRIWRTQAGGVTRVVVAIAQGRGIGKLEQLRVESEGTVYDDYAAPWALVPGQCLPMEFYVDGSSKDYWEARTTELERPVLERPVPDWAPEKLRRARIDMLDTPYIEPFQPGLQGDPNGNGPSADFGVSTNGHEGWLCPEGFALHALEMHQVAQRERVFHMDSNGEPEWRDLDDYWMTETPPGYGYDADLVREWFPEHDQMDRLKTHDDQHFARAWRSAAILAPVDPFAAWYLAHCNNRMELQWRSSQDRDSALYRGIDSVLSRLVDGQGSPSLGRAGCWAADLALAAGSGLVPKFRELFERAAGVSCEIHADRSPGYANWAREELGHNAPLSMNHEMAIGSAVMRRYGLTDLADDLASLLLPYRGKATVFGEDRWTGNPNPWTEMQAGDFSRVGGSVEAFLVKASRRDPLEGFFLACPRRYWEVAL